MSASLRPTNVLPHQRNPEENFSRNSLIEKFHLPLKIASSRKIHRTLSEDEQRELVQRVIDEITVHPTTSERKGEVRNPDRRVLIEIRLRMGTLVRTEAQSGRKLKVMLDVTLHRGKALWASAAGDVALDIRKPEPTRSKKKPPRKTRRHEIHRADKIAKEMNKRGWTASE